MTTTLRDQIIITDASKHCFEGYSDLELSARYSKNKNNFDIFEKLLYEKIHENKIINELLFKTIILIDSTASIDAIKLLIKCGADVNSKDCLSNTLLMHCCYYPIKIEMFEFLIEKGADVNIKNSYGSNTLLFHFSRISLDDDLEIIKLLIRKDKKINCRNDCGETPIIKYFNNNHKTIIRFDIIKLLLESKIDIYIKDKEGKNILDIIEKKIGKQNCKNSDIYSLIFNYKNIINDHLCEFNINFIYYNI